MPNQPKILVAVDVQRQFGLAPKADPERYRRIVDYIRNRRDEYLKVYATVCHNDPSTNMYISGAWDEIASAETDLPLDFDADSIVAKHTYGMPFRYLLGMLTYAIDNTGTTRPQIDVIGYNTDCCVLAVALQLFDLDTDVRVLTDYCWSSSGEAHHIRGVELLRDILGDFVI